MGVQTLLLLGLLTLLAIISKAFCIKCLQCTTLVNKGCSTGNFPATGCKPDDKYCVTYTGNVNAGFVVFRGCNPEPIEKCSEGVVEDQRVTTCYTTCNYTGCNNAHYSSSASTPSLHVMSTYISPTWLPVILTLIRESLVYYRVT